MPGPRIVADWEEMIDVNLRGVLYGIAAALPVFRGQGSGHFVTTASDGDAPRRGGPGHRVRD